MLSFHWRFWFRSIQLRSHAKNTHTHTNSSTLKCDLGVLYHNFENKMAFNATHLFGFYRCVSMCRQISSDQNTLEKKKTITYPSSKLSEEEFLRWRLFFCLLLCVIQAKISLALFNMLKICLANREHDLPRSSVLDSARFTFLHTWNIYSKQSNYYKLPWSVDAIGVVAHDSECVFMATLLP